MCDLQSLRSSHAGPLQLPRSTANESGTVSEIRSSLPCWVQSASRLWAVKQGGPELSSTMRRVRADLSVGMAAGAGTLLLTLLVEGMPNGIRLAVVAGVVAASVLSAHLLARRAAVREGSRVAVGSSVRSRGSVSVSDVRADGSDDTRIGSDVKADGDVTVRHINVGRPRPLTDSDE